MAIPTPRTANVLFMLKPMVAAGSNPLEQRVQEGKFRQDLFYRLNVIPMHLPPLRDRKEDIPALTNNFLHEFSIKRGVAMEISPEAMQCLIDYSYPGNVRELKNIIERASVLAPDQEIKVDDLPADLLEANGYKEAGESFLISDAVAKTEKQVLLKALAHTKGKKGEAAELLGISRKNLWEKMKLYRML